MKQGRGEFVRFSLNSGHISVEALGVGVNKCGESGSRVGEREEELPFRELAHLFFSILQ